MSDKQIDIPDLIVYENISATISILSSFDTLIKFGLDKN